MVQSAQVSDLDNFQFVNTRLLKDDLIDWIERNEVIVQNFLNDDKFRQTVEDLMTPAAYREVRGEASEIM